MPREEIASESGRAIYDVLDALFDTMNRWEFLNAVEEWVNDNFGVESGDLQMDGPDDWWIENLRLGWK